MAITTLQLTGATNEALVVPGGSTAYLFTLQNTGNITTTGILTTSDALSLKFVSTLDRNTFTLAPGEAAQTTLTVLAIQGDDRDLTNETVLRAMIAGEERARASVITRLTFPKFGRVFTGIGVGDHSVSPGTKIDVQVVVTSPVWLPSAVLADNIPAGWSVLDAGGGQMKAGTGGGQVVEWSLGDLPANLGVKKTYTVSSPPLSSTASSYAFSSVLSNPNVRLASDPWPVVLSHPLIAANYRIGRNQPLDKMDYYADAGVPAQGIPRFEAFRVRFQVVNDQGVPVQWQPALSWAPSLDAAFQPLPAGDGQAQVPFYIRPLSDLPDGQTIATKDFGLDGQCQNLQDGSLFTKANPGPVLTLNPLSCTEVEFSVRATVDAAYGRAYYFRLSDDGRPMVGSLAEIVMGPQPAPKLTYPQYAGTDTGPRAPADAEVLATIGQLSVAVPLSTLGLVQVQGSYASPHGPYEVTTGDCASCHRSHTAQNRNSLPAPPAQSNVCFGCHDGSASNQNVKSQFADPAVPGNNPGTSSFYSHPATTSSTHTVATDDEFHNVTNRHAECGDCHNAHNVKATPAVSTAAGYTVSGALQGMSGLSVANGGPGTAPTYTWSNSSTYEYEVCLKCHSSYTNLLSYTTESYKKLDKATELNPANPSYHPVEAAGKNSTTAMANSLSGGSPYKLWTFTPGSVIRCVNCHGDYRLANPTTPPAADGALAAHTSKYRGLLMNNLRDRDLKPYSATNDYAASDFALCYQCHAEAPFVDVSASPRTDTDFSFHGYHMMTIYNNPTGGGASTDIDTPGAGQGNAVCSECHYRVHGQGNDARGNPSGLGLVNFAPDVTASANGQLLWDPVGRTCTLTCHGKDHQAKPY